MGENTKIEWTDHTFNPWIGCTKVGPGCDHCYAEQRMDTRLHRVRWGAGQPRQRTKTWGDPVRWNKQHDAFVAEHGRRQRVFCASLADVFDNAVDPQWRADLFDLIAATPNLDWLLLTKRIGNARSMLDDAMLELSCGSFAWTAEAALPNVWLGATVVNQAEADRDIPKLLAVPARVRFLSIEPMLGPINLYRIALAEGLDLCALRGLERPHEAAAYRTPLGRIDWVICGGESGPRARPMHPEWARSLRDQCAAAGVPFLFKQWGEWMPPYGGGMPGWSLAEGIAGRRTALLDNAVMTHVGKKAAGRLLDGRTHDGFPR